MISSNSIRDFIFLHSSYKKDTESLRPLFEILTASIFNVRMLITYIYAMYKSYHSMSITSI